MSMRRKLSKPTARSTMERTNPSQNSMLMSRPSCVSLPGMLCIRGGSDIFTEVIQAGEHASIVTFTSGGDRFIECFAGDEPARHTACSAIGSDPISEAFTFGKLEERRPAHAGIIMAA